jgi:ribosome recycling factor
MHGSPCQDFSVAGKGAGGDEGSGTRSSLMYETIRIVNTQLTEERREELVKQVKKLAEEEKIAIRNIRKNAMDDIKEEAENEDEQDRLEKQLQDQVNEYNKKIEEELKKKEEELRTV